MRTWPGTPGLVAVLALTISASQASASRGGGGEEALAFFVIFAIVFAVLLALLFIPSFVAFGRGHPNRWIILVVNAVFGATGLGWLGCLVWAFNAVHRSTNGSDGGESGLNIFVNDVHRLPAATHDLVPLEQLGRLKLLLDEGALDESEYKLVKARLLGVRTSRTI